VRENQELPHSVTASRGDEKVNCSGKRGDRLLKGRSQSETNVPIQGLRKRVVVNAVREFGLYESRRSRPYIMRE